MSDIDRITKLKNKGNYGTLTIAELDEFIRLCPDDLFLTLPNIKKMGVLDIEKSLRHFQEGSKRSRNAFEHGCYLEVISLGIQHIDFWLRMYYVAKNGKGKIFEKKDRRTFGMIIDDCKKLGFRSNLISILRDFNEKRILAIHKYLLGGTDYDELKDVCKSYSGLDIVVQEYVVEQVGVASHKAKDLVGKMVIRKVLIKK
jgi:hypothetical protein